MKEFIPILAGLLCVVACSQRIESPEESVVRATIIADSPSYSTSPSTRTEIYTLTTDDDKEEIHTYWSIDDGLCVALCVDGMTTSPGLGSTDTWDFASNNSLASQTATFTFKNNGPEPPIDGNTFFAIHPLVESIETMYYQGSDDKYYSGFFFYLPVEQHPGAQTFDNDADLLVSESFSFDPSNPIVDGLAFTRMNAIVKINFIDKTSKSLFAKMGINAVTFGPKTGDKYLTGYTFCQPHDELYECCATVAPEYFDVYPAYPYVSADYYGRSRPSIGAIDAVYLMVHPTVLMNSDYPDGFPVHVEMNNDHDDYSVTRYISFPEGGIVLPAGLVTTLNVSLYDNGVNNTTFIK